jgi:hypothetical protein
VKKIVRIFLIAAFITGSVSAQESKSFGRLHLIDSYVLPHNQLFKETTVGGLSGIDYDRENALYYLVSDDRSALNPARFYTAKIVFNTKKIDTVAITDVHFMLQPNGKTYPNSKQDPAHTPDPESIRYDPVHKRVFWTSEGERIIRSKDTVLENPAITIVSTDGKYIDSFPLPENLYMHATEKGPRQNGVLEGMSFADHYQTLYVNVEEPLYEDGPRADTMPNKAWIRIFRFDARTKKNTAQYAYQLDPVAYPANPSTAFKINGVPDILDAGKGKLIVLERSFSTGRLPCTIKIFLADLNVAADIRHNTSLIKTPPAKPVNKKLLLNMDSLGVYVDNVEGITFGPDLPNGHKTLVLVADNNFAIFEQTQFFVFELIPG